MDNLATLPEHHFTCLLSWLRNRQMTGKRLRNVNTVTDFTKHQSPAYEKITFKNRLFFRSYHNDIEDFMTV